MQKIQDSKDNQWSLSITLNTAKNLRKDSVDLLDLKQVNEILSDPIEAFNLLYILCEKQAIEREIDDEQFGELFVGCGEAALDALVLELENFTQAAGRPAMGAMIRKVWAVSKKEQTRKVGLLREQKMDQVLEKLMDQEFEKVTKSLQELAGTKSTNSQE